METIDAKSVVLITRNEAMRRVLRDIDRVAESEASILLVGETGVGKELLAEYIHRVSPRCGEPLVKVSLSSIPAELLESELFGHERGAYTNATEEKKGLFEMADRGSIFLDDIDDVPIQMQSKLLRFIESRELMHVGGTRSRPVDVRFITASKVDLKELVKRNIFRADLFYRLNVVPFPIPPLRERRDDIPLLVEHFNRLFQPAKQITFTQAALKSLVDYPWPGNVRELRNVVQRVVLLAEREVTQNDLPIELRLGGGDSMNLLIKECYRCFQEGTMSYEQVLTCLEHNLISTALEKAGGNQSKAAKSLGLSLSTFRDKLKKSSTAS